MAEQILKVIGGAGIIGLFDWVLEHIWEKSGKPKKFPWIETPIAPMDDLLLGIPAIGLYFVDKDVGKGAIGYWLGMLIHHALLRQITWK